ncbi:MAG TPA: isopeptide-forming domain-containing fimbrial protein [Polyangiaceae bacterium]|nr:isopeptide-forming domain-containing fimbrial protein [Polyangiaceae bacterium]HNZ22013.1 isopeptide-forming domain-containing fimbrial protein [Polyangiaceae bacterium]HOD25033.1 isopeptide-forming domain-containing fimbrial protein [Polyangiaceae bacterium]HOH00634.1 isopeptide-forming domain-containing fimbrial protein [Polyangiaceae bacterium]HOR36164.1 isopeptide-forming domain-containing fimbrial protein [Polyangiaceae bacterium]
MTTASPAGADPIPRYQANVKGNVRVFGSTLTYDCGSKVLPPPGATASCAGQKEVSDSAGDLYWRDNLANVSVEPKQARTSATLDLPSGSVVTYARLYWSALKVGDQPDKDAVLDWVNGSPTTIVSDHCHPTIPFPFSTHPDWFYYQCSGDATDYVRKLGAGDFRVTDVDAIPLANTLVHVSYAAWTLVVFYENPKEEVRNLALFDGFEKIDPEFGPSSVSATLSGIIVPSGFAAEMTAFMYEGDVPEQGEPPQDRFLVNGIPMSNAITPGEDFFNSSRSYLGLPYSGDEDVPQFSGVPGSMAGYDLHTVDVRSAIKAGDTSVVITADSDYDKYLLGGFVTSITNKAPYFDVTKQVEDVNGGAVMPGDVLEYTIKAQNTGNDTAIKTVITDQLQPGITFVPESIRIVSGGVVGPKTDKAGDDQAEFVNGRVTIRVGAGATATEGGKVAPSEKVEVKFRVTVTATKGEIANSATLRASGEAGGAEEEYESDGDPNTVGKQSTVVVVDECSSDDDCSGLKPHCDPETHTCVGCKTDADCHDPANPACQPSGACGQCSATNDVLCTGNTPVCDTSVGICVLCTPGPNGDASMCKDDPNGPVCMSGANGSLFCGCVTDSDCGSYNSGRVCDTLVQHCIDGCRGEGGNSCPTELVCTSHDSSIGQCIVDTGTGDAGGAGGAGGGGVTAAPEESGEDGGCACSTVGHKSWGGAFAAGLFAFGAVALVRRRRR